MEALPIMREKANFVYITPASAKAYLEKNIKNNRPLNLNKVNRYAALMRDGRWYASFLFPIAFDTNGALCDGQHRLNAVIATGMSVPFLVVKDVDPELIKYIDTGAARTNRQIIKMATDDVIKRHAAIQALAKHIGAQIDKTQTYDVSPDELMRMIDKRWYLYEHIYNSYISPFPRLKVASKHALTAIVSLECNNINEELIMAFYRCMNNNEDAPSGRNGKAVRDFVDWYNDTKDSRNHLCLTHKTLPQEVFDRTQRAFYMFAQNVRKTTKSGAIYPITSQMLDALNRKYEEEAGK